MLARDGGMYVPNITQSPGSVATLARAVAAPEAASPQHVASGSDAPGASSPGSSSTDTASNSVSLARLAWFDVNGDGHIDPRSTTSGGDATLLVPSHSVELPTYRRTVNGVGGPRPANPSETPPSVPATAAQTSRAVDAYERYGAAAVASAVPLPASSTASGADRTVA
ncbi:MAG: hypothetical protein JWM72_2989 [Actinomycetia bacterium]|nr:hypothetical protein [Actinomycetes bacterium]